MSAWKHVAGSIEVDGEITTFRLEVTVPREGKGRKVAQRVDISTARLERYPAAYARTLDLMVRDLDTHVRADG